MIKIRNSVFETNSSSMHSLVIKKNGSKQDIKDILDTIYVRKDGSYHIYDEEISFDRYPFRILFTAVQKFLYIYAESSSDKRKELLEFMKKTYPEIKEYEFPKKYWIDEEDEDNNEDKYYYGQVDHQSMGFVTNYLKNNNISYEDFITNTKYTVIIDGDEYGEWEKFKKSGLINLDEIETDINPFNSRIKTFEDENGYEE